MDHLSADTIVITAIGMNTSLGHAETACAAARAGLSAAREMEHYLVFDEDGVDEKAIGHPVRTAAGFQGVGKLCALGFPALVDLLHGHELHYFNPDRTGFLVCLDGPVAEAEADDEDEGEDEGEEDAEEEEEVEAPPLDASWGPRLWGNLTEMAQLGLPASSRRILVEGRCGFVKAIEEAQQKLRSGQWHRCIVGAVDSLVEDRKLHWVYMSGQMRTFDKPDGLHPGEAGAFLMLERYDSARDRGAKALAKVGVTALGQEEGEEGTSGMGLWRVMAGVVPTGARWWLVSDHNGEHDRAMDLGNALGRLEGEKPMGVWYPAENFGDVGAAAGVVGACMVVRGLVRGYARGGCGVVVASDADGGRAALRLEGVGRL